MRRNGNRKLLTERLYLNWASDSLRWTVRMAFRLADAVDGSMLREAVGAAQRRYPYYSVKVVVRTDEQGVEHYAYEDNAQPWVLKEGREPVTLMGDESNRHLLAFCYWDDWVAIDLFHSLTDGTGAFNVMRTLLYEYCRRRYDNGLSREGVWVAGDVTAAEEWDDLTAVPRPLKPRVVAPPDELKAIDLSREAKAPLADVRESVFVSFDEEQMMRYVACHDTTPATLVALLLSRAIARLHPDAGEKRPIAGVAFNLRRMLGVDKAPQAVSTAVDLELTREMQQLPIGQQESLFRKMTAEQTTAEWARALFWSIVDGQDQLEQYVPTVETRFQAMSGAIHTSRAMNSCLVSYMGRSDFGPSQPYIRDIYTEGDSPLMLTIELNAVNGKFCMNVEQQFATDLYLDAFLDEFRQLGIDCKIVSRQPMLVAPVADFRKKERTTPELITSLEPDEIFVFGSNLEGMHGGGAAYVAYRKFGAVMGQGVGLQGQSYGIPTMQGGVETIRPYVDEFIEFTRQHPELTFLVTRIGCGIAGFTDAEIAPLFRAAHGVRNIVLPPNW